MERFINAIKTEDIEALSRVIYYDETGAAYPLDETQKVLDKYKDTFDINNLAWSFSGDVGEFNDFICDIYELNAADSKLHQVHIITGDGQVGLMDEWIRNYYELNN